MEEMKDCMTTASTEGSTLTYEKIVEACDLVRDMKPISTNFAAASDLFKNRNQFKEAGFSFNEEEKQYEYHGIIIKENKYLPDGFMVDMDEIRRQMEKITSPFIPRKL